MLSRRSLFSLFAGTAALAAGNKAAEASPVDVKVNLKWVPASDPTPRPEHYVRTYYPRGTILRIDHLDGSRHTWISDGRTMRAIETDEGQKILMESAVNVRADGSIRHRQHHPVDFPPKR